MTSAKLLLGFLSVALLAGAGLAQAHGPGSGDAAPGFPVRGERCDDNMTVGACRALLGDPCNDAMTVKECRDAAAAKRAEMENLMVERCRADTGNATWCDHPFPPMRGPGGPEGPGPMGHGMRGHRGPPPQ